jgi:dipeptidase D
LQETGLTGAFDLHPDLLKGRTMLNLDTEDWGEIFIGVYLMRLWRKE